MPIVRRRFDPTKRNGLSADTLARLDAMTAEQIEDNARTDTDNPPMTEDELDRAVFGRAVRLTREKQGLSQKEFAARFNINLRRLQDWEQGRFTPDSVTQAYLKLIEREPELVRRILEAA